MSHPSIEQGGNIVVTLPSALKLVVCLPSRAPTMAELQRMKRQFVNVHKKAITLGTTERGAVDWSENSVGERFVEYLKEQYE